MLLKSILQPSSVSCFQRIVAMSVRQKHRVYIQKPYPRPKMMQIVEDLSKPIVGANFKQSFAEPCTLQDQISHDSSLTEYEQFLSRRLLEMFGKSENGMVAAFHPPSVSGRDWREIKIKFNRHGISLRVFHPRIVHEVLLKTKYSALSQLLPAPLVLGFSSEPKTLELSAALKLCPNMQLLACAVYDRMLSRGQLDSLNSLGTNNADVVAQSIMINKSMPASLVMLLKSNYVNTVRILQLHGQKTAEQSTK